MRLPPRSTLFPYTTLFRSLVLTVTQLLRSVGVVGKFVEYFGDGLAGLSVADRATVANMRSEEHTSELQSRGNLVCRLLPENRTRSSHRWKHRNGRSGIASS